jgi:hypothetical protein
MSLNDTMDAFEAEILSILENMKDVGLVPYFERAEKGRLRPVDIFPIAFFWLEPRVPLGNDYLDGDLIKQTYTIAGFDYNPDIIYDYDLAEERSKKMGNDLRDEFTKWEHRNLSGTVFQSQVITVFVDPGGAPFPGAEGGLMAAGGVELLVVYRQNRGS